MKKEVLITITGIQNEYERENPIRQLVPGEYYFRNGKHFLVYEEVIEDDGNFENNRCMMKISPDCVEISKRGGTTVQMKFILHKKTLTSYPSPFGIIMTGFDTHSIRINQYEDRLELFLGYELEMNGSFISDCEISVIVEDR